jgi:uncharacterized membrane protein (DUF4010 family)
MNTRKLWSIIVSVVAVVIASYVAESRVISNKSVPTYTVDGTAPLPPLPWLNG